MSDLRKQLQSLRDDYRTEKYPGDLAAEVMAPPRLHIGKFAVAAAAITALAAAVALWVSIEPAVVAPLPTVEVATTEQTSATDALATAVPVQEMGAMPEFPDDLPLVPDSFPLVPEGGSITDLGSMPEMPSVDMSFSFDT